MSNKRIGYARSAQGAYHALMYSPVPLPSFSLKLIEGLTLLSNWFNGHQDLHGGMVPLRPEEWFVKDKQAIEWQRGKDKD